ncbi:hypothetical protein HG536_0A04840 [Torulaspora globosa]|uniref:PX domain-containing protein n=1 Tax=Torulaspora globosa TaxID=48254 RepID=A0A7G3ZAY3_9SACH|nr:uncharacterized protein HG536_0A04840 [Torulaspora globosa]QLL30669.1 hypothetical protein HG536_0A04840 [Torulaspora globosa]
MEPYEPADDMVDNNPFGEPVEQPEAQEQREEGQEEVEPAQEPGSGAEQIDLLPERTKSGKYRLLVKVTALERVGNVTSKRENPVVVFDVSTNVPTFRKSQHRKVRKTADEFRQLFKFLNGAIQESFIASLPPTYTSLGINNEEDYTQTMGRFQQWFNRICDDPLVVRNEEVAFFIESDFGSYSPISESKLPASGLRRKTLKQLSPPYDEVVELAEFRPLVKSVHWVSQDIQAKLAKVCKGRKILAQEENALGQGFVALHEDQQLYKNFGKVLTANGDIDSIMATLDLGTLHDGLEWIVRDTYVVKEALTNRHLIMRDLLQAQQTSKMRQERARKLRAKRDISPLKVDEALRQLKAATRDESELTVKLQRITANMCIEKNLWLSWFEDFLSSSIRDYTMRKIEYERKKLSLLERIRSDVRKADTKGGLSRLGREASLAKMKQDRQLSQTLDGDNWTGDVRRRSQVQFDKLSQTEFDKALNLQEPSSQRDLHDKSSLDARHAAIMLGLPTF